MKLSRQPSLRPDTSRCERVNTRNCDQDEKSAETGSFTPTEANFRAADDCKHEGVTW